MPLSNQRDLFEIPDEVAYLNCAYMSPLLRSAREAGQAAVARKARPWEIHSGDFFDEAEVARALFAQLIEADADAIAVVPSASYGIAVAAANLSPRANQRILVLEDQFPSNVYAWRELAARTGAELVTVPRPPDFDWTRALLEQLDERIAVVAVPPCHWTDGSLVDLVRVGERARVVGAALVVDATQSLGAYPLDIAQVQPDFLACAAYKWLLGPYSVGFLYVAPRWREGRPLEYNWIARAGSDDFAGLVAYADGFQPGARRFDMGERSNFALLPMVATALRQLLAWRVDAIQSSLRELTARIEREALGIGLMPVPAGRRVDHLLGLRSARPLPPQLLERLEAEQVYVSVRGPSLRVSPHVYNTAADIERLFAVLGKLL